MSSDLVIIGDPCKILLTAIFLTHSPYKPRIIWLDSSSCIETWARPN